MLNFRKSYSGQNCLILAQSNREKSVFVKYHDIDRISRPSSACALKTRSAYGETPVLRLTSERPFVLEHNLLIELMRQGKKQKFIQGFEEHARDAQINQLMYNIYVNGQNFSSEHFIPSLVYERDVTGKTILHYAVAGDADLGQPLIKNVVLYRYKGVEDYEGISAMMIAAYLGHNNQVEELLPYELNLKDSMGRSAIMHACAGRRVEIVSLLWKYQCNDKDKESETVGHYITKYGIREKILKFLTLEYGKTAANKLTYMAGAGNGRVDVISRMDDQEYVSIKIE